MSLPQKQSAIFHFLIRSLAPRLAYWLNRLWSEFQRQVPWLGCGKWPCGTAGRCTRFNFLPCSLRPHLRKHHSAPPGAETRQGECYWHGWPKTSPTSEESDFPTTPWFTTWKKWWQNHVLRTEGTNATRSSENPFTGWGITQTSKSKLVTDSPRCTMIWQTSNLEELSRPICNMFNKLMLQWFAFLLHTFLKKV